MSRGLPTALLFLALAGGCKGSSKEGPNLQRRGDLPPVVVVDRPDEGADLTPESEPNDDKAQPLKPPGVRGVLSGQTDIDRFAVEVAEEGFLSAVAGGIDDVDLMVELQDEAGKRLVKSDRGPTRISEGVPNYRVTPGRYIVQVAEFVPKKRKQPREGDSSPYALRVSLVPSPAEGYELEPNSEASGAVTLDDGQEGFGYLGWNADVDCWMVTTPEMDGETLVALDLVVEGVPGVTAQLSIETEKGEVLISREGNEGGAIRAAGLVATGNDRLALVLRGKRSNPDQPYKIKVASRPLADDDEREPNDTVSGAMLLPAEQGILKASGGSGDVDHFAWPAGAGNRIGDVSAIPGGETDVAIELISAGGDVLMRADAGKAGHRELLSGIPLAAGARLYLRVTASGRDLGGAEYRLDFAATETTEVLAPLTPIGGAPDAGTP